ncbi:metallophosphoesterase [Ciceribacter sp. L1K22]|uniref:metallophosphoesterase family protein n=1 Tax=Ciceribacter sp. L1K22 TaxID=2820275 RepID=UPI001ABE29B6|nr:metallophosphoesterase [Ciceribacter sp. L1K22]MBO3761051.1 metallophosphoesterase [Ciceribacter sp. L1K22]
MFKLAHISDIHLGPLPKLTLRELASKRITGYVNWHRNRRKHLFANALDLVMEGIAEARPDHLAITGDMVNLATAMEIRMVSDWLKHAAEPLSTSIVPGNHDAYVPGAHAKTVSAWYDYMRGDDDPLVWEDDHKLFPYIRRRGPVAIIGCSTSIATPPFSAMGYFSARQARETANLLKAAGEEGLFRVVLIHHPPVRGAASRYKRMVGIRRFGAAISVGGAELVLHGHTHLNTQYTLPSRGRPIPVIGIASASQGPGGHKPAAAFNLFGISGKSGAWTLDWQRHSLREDLQGTEMSHHHIFSL